MNAAITTGKQYTTFYVGKMMFGIDVHLVQEIIRYQEMTPVPLSSPVVRGLINLRGQIITAIDLRRRLQLADADENSPRPMNVVIRLADETFSLLVDKIGDVIETSDIPFEQTPPTLDPDLKKMVNGVYKLNDGLLLALTPEKVVDLTTIQ